MQTLDWIIFAVYLLFVFLLGIWASKKSSTGIESYFVADRNLPWWWLGISIIATTFAADTPLAVTGITANNGIVGNWLWWTWAATYITVAIFFAQRWRKSGVLTDVEFIELRYDGKQAALLRGFKAFFFGVVLNCFILGWVITAAVSIASPFIQWSEFMPTFYAFVENVYPSFLLFKGDLNATITIVFLLIIVLSYSSMGGIRGVILTDLVQFGIAMLTSIFFAYYAVSELGGMGEIQAQLLSIYGETKTQNFTEFLPSFDNPLLPFQIFLIYTLVQWWVRFDSDGTGYIAQRINTAKSAKDAQKGSLFFAVAFIALRTWPWILIGLVSLVMFPIGNESIHFAEGALVKESREVAYPIIMKLILPVGLLGLTFTSLMAAFMSTVDTHLNWGSSYLTNDIYRRFWKKDATEKELLRFSRWMVLLITLLAIITSSQMTSIEGAWKFFINAAAGLGIAQLMRWFWWRANAYTEISAMLVAIVLTAIFTLVKPESASSHYDTYGLVFISVATIVISILVSLLTKPVSETHLQVFVEKCLPIGIWKNMAPTSKTLPKFLESFLMWILGLSLSFSGLFAIGHLLFARYLWFGICILISVVSWIILQKLMEKESKFFN
ncbi:MAG: Na+:solute symporter [Chitinophagales bacterium]|nr:Na+:solute symporter [Bacteroidota bacterium]MCB9257007.1 Na+:solute symporter [Chitinophagales bacterium]